ncbi:MAG: 2-C-methyl-D-erythritol 2,4-cyclodiphosphate synthase [Candidatus Muiribacteriota bacterium]
MRIGIGYDVHRFCDNRKLILGGVEIPHEKGLDGHSDADVLIHAVMDSMLGALALGDIGKYFPDTDNSFKDIDSCILLKKCMQIIKKKGYQVGNIDTVLILQKPKIAPFIDAMNKKMSDVLDIPEGLLGIKATTEEYLGFTGREEGIKAVSVCILKKIKKFGREDENVA